MPPACPNILSERDDRGGTSFCNWTSGTGRAAPLSKVDVRVNKDTGFTLLTGGARWGAADYRLPLDTAASRGRISVGWILTVHWLAAGRCSLWRFIEVGLVSSNMFSRDIIPNNIDGASVKFTAGGHHTGR